MELRSFLKQLSYLSETSDKVEDPTTDLDLDALSEITVEHPIVADIFAYLQE